MENSVQFFVHRRIFKWVKWVEDWKLFSIISSLRNVSKFAFSTSISFVHLNDLYFLKAEEPSLSYYLSITGGRIIGFIPFPRVLVLCEMQSVSSRIWTRVAVSISYDYNHYTTGELIPLEKIWTTLFSLSYWLNSTTSVLLQWRLWY